MVSLTVIRQKRKSLNLQFDFVAYPIHRNKQQGHCVLFRHSNWKLGIYSMKPVSIFFFCHHFEFTISLLYFFQCNNVNQEIHSYKINGNIAHRTLLRTASQLFFLSGHSPLIQIKPSLNIPRQKYKLKDDKLVRIKVRLNVENDMLNSKECCKQNYWSFNWFWFFKYRYQSNDNYNVEKICNWLSGFAHGTLHTMFVFSYRPMWNWNWMDDIEKHKCTSFIPLRSLCTIS